MDLAEVKNSKHKISDFHRCLGFDSRRKVSAGKALVLACMVRHIKAGAVVKT